MKNLTSTIQQMTKKLKKLGSNLDVLGADSQSFFFIKIWKSNKAQQQINNLMRIITNILSFKLSGFTLMRIQCNIIPNSEPF